MSTTLHDGAALHGGLGNPSLENISDRRQQFNHAPAFDLVRAGSMTSATCPQLATVAEPTCSPGVSRDWVLGLAASAHDVLSAKPTTTHGRVQPQAALAGASPGVPRPSIRGPPHR